MWISSSPNCWNFDVKTNLPFCTTFRAGICPSLSPIESHFVSSCTSTLGGSLCRLLARHSRNEKQLDSFFWTEFPCFFSFGTSIRVDRKSGVLQKQAPVLYTIAWKTYIHTYIHPLFVKAGWMLMWTCYLLYTKKDQTKTPGTLCSTKIIFVNISTKSKVGQRRGVILQRHVAATRFRDKKTYILSAQWGHM